MEGENGARPIPTAHAVSPFLLKAAEIILVIEVSRIIKSTPEFSQVLALVCIFPASIGTRVELLRAALNYLDTPHMQHS